MAELRLGILGMSEGNGHPYSWSAIFNGYEPTTMADCGFPGIPIYLANQKFPDDCIAGARVTHVWTQDALLSQHISNATYIDTVVPSPEDMIGAVDAVLLARDDAENHRQFADPFLAAGLPVYVDKPFAHSRRAAEAFFSQEVRAAQIFSCSALRFAQEMLVPSEELARIGGVTRISAQVPKSWTKYAIHVIDPILANCGKLPAVSDARVRQFGTENDCTEVSFAWDGGERTCEITAYGREPSPISVSYSGPGGTIRTEFADSFAAFKRALCVFLEDSVIGRHSHAAQILDAIDILELGT